MYVLASFSLKTRLLIYGYATLISRDTQCIYIVYEYSLSLSLSLCVGAHRLEEPKKHKTVYWAELCR